MLTCLQKSTSSDHTTYPCETWCNFKYLLEKPRAFFLCKFRLLAPFLCGEMVLFTHIDQHGVTACVNADSHGTVQKSCPVLSTHSELPPSPALHGSTAKQHRCIKKLMRLVSGHGSFLQPFRVCSPGRDPSPSTREEEAAPDAFTHHSCISWHISQTCSSVREG